ncbi:MAG: Urease accessory protein UreG [Syntrophorhabdus sp. PtaU1.Bin002]|nr:MAG: Urease accessory protein UreG [Syntrophorhabdus sp. PtaU1.Bin002]
MIRFATVAGPPSSGKTSVVLKAIDHLKTKGLKAGVIKFDCTVTYDDLAYKKNGIPVKIGLSGTLCPDHFFISNVEECLSWGMAEGIDILITESAGLCNRCAPHIKDALAICVIDNLSGINTPKKIGPMLKLADIVVITKGDIVSQAEREIFTFRIKQANPRASIVNINGVTGQGAHDLGAMLESAPGLDALTGQRLRFSMPAALCSYCLGQTKIGKEYQMGYVRKMKW